jgi:hypothetical protein
LSTELGISYGFIFDIVHDVLQYWKVSALGAEVSDGKAQTGETGVLSHGFDLIHCKEHSISEEDCYR